MKNALLIIDAQYDFCHPNGALFVPGAVEDMQKLSALILKNADKIDHITVTLDNHPVNDISHPSFWQDEHGAFPPPFTQITAADIHAGKWTARFDPEKARQYITDLETQGKFLHFIWPEHCLIGSQGAGLDATLLTTLKTWSRSQQKDYQVVTKGTNPFTEHFGIFQAQIPIADAPETQLNTSLIADLLAYDAVYLAGQAKSHCVATSLQQAMDLAPELASKMIVLEDCMSDVTGLGHLGEPIYATARQQGIKFAKAEEVVFDD
ncbi:MAG: nicotinamidase [Verrucomicrobia bacterium]|nr:nicotinamidase [Cytophagales bacterium]